MIYCNIFKKSAVVLLFLSGLFLAVGVSSNKSTKTGNFTQAYTDNTGTGSPQKLNDFYLSNYKEDGVQEWEIKGKEADIYDKHVDIDKMEAKYYAHNDTISIQSENAKLNKENMDVYLKENVHMENKEGMKLDTDSLNWKREANKLETDDWVKAEGKFMNIKAKGLSADTELKTADFEENVQVKLADKNSKDVTTINCNGPLEIDYSKGEAVFNNKVVAENKEGKMFADKSTVYFDVKGKKIIKMISEGNVRIIRDENVTFAEKATYMGDINKLVLEGNPRIIYFVQDNGDGGPFGSNKDSSSKNKTNSDLSAK